MYKKILLAVDDSENLDQATREVIELQKKFGSEVVLFHSESLVQNFINFCGPTNKEGILHSEILLVSNLETPNFLPVNLFSKKSQESICGNVCKECEAFLDGTCNGCGYF